MTFRAVAFFGGAAATLTLAATQARKPLARYGSDTRSMATFLLLKDSGLLEQKLKPLGLVRWNGRSSSRGRR